MRATKANDLGSNQKTHVVEGRNQLSKSCSDSQVNDNSKGNMFKALGGAQKIGEYCG